MASLDRTRSGSSNAHVSFDGTASGVAQWLSGTRKSATEGAATGSDGLGKGSTMNLHDAEEEAEEVDDLIAAHSVPWLIFLYLMRFAIVLNVMSLGLAVQYREHVDTWEALEHVFTAVFAFEMMIKLVFMRRRYFHDSWNRLDFGLAWLSILDVWLLPYVGSSPLPISINGVRLLRLLRVLRAVRILEIKKELLVMVSGLMASVKALVWITLLMLVVIYTSALFMIAALADYEYDPSEFNTAEMFGDLGQSMITMFNICIQAQWVEIVQPAYRRQWHVAVFLIMYVFLTTFAILNLVIGVITERTMAAQADFEQMQEQRAKRARMRHIVDLADAIFAADEDGGVEMQEMVKLVTSRPELKEMVSSCGLPRGFDIGDLHLIFDEGCGGTVDKEEFLNGMFRLIFNTDFQRDCCTLLTVAQVKAEVKSGFDRLKEDVQRNTQLLRLLGRNFGVHMEGRSTQGQEKSLDMSTRICQELRSSFAELQQEVAKWSSADPPGKGESPLRSTLLGSPERSSRSCVYDVPPEVPALRSLSSSSDPTSDAVELTPLTGPGAAGVVALELTSQELLRCQETLRTALREHLRALRASGVAELGLLNQNPVLPPVASVSAGRQTYLCALKAESCFGGTDGFRAISRV